MTKRDSVVDKHPSSIPGVWPTPEAEQVEVLLLGMYHMDNPRLDKYNVNPDDVLAPDRQAELETLAECLADFGPERIAVERPYDKVEEINEQYERYQTGEWAYDEEVEFDSVHPMRNDPTAECRSEVVQVGFRLADRLNHDHIYPIDAPTLLGTDDDTEALEERGFEPTDKIDYQRWNGEELLKEANERLRESTLPEFLGWINSEEYLRFNHRSMFGEYIRFGQGDNFAGPETLETWYGRNLKMVHNLWRSIEAGDERAMIVVGAGHIRILRHLLTESPMFAPVSPLSYLSPSDA